MAGGEVVESKSKSKGPKKKKKRVGIHIDMTPMVDVALLLITFFMLTTVFSLPQTMELNLPPDGDKTKVEVAATTLVTLRVAPDKQIYWSSGDKDAELQKIEFTNLRSFLKQRLADIPKLITLVRIDRDAKYTDMVDIIDELNLANITKFSIAPLQENDKKLLQKAMGK